MSRVLLRWYLCALSKDCPSVEALSSFGITRPRLDDGSAGSSLQSQTATSGTPDVSEHMTTVLLLQTVAGAIATGTHGSSLVDGSLSEQVGTDTAFLPALQLL